MLATLVSTVAGTFITSINLYDRLVEQRRQKKLDRGQNKRIKELEQRLNEEQEEKERIREEGSSSKQSKAGDGERDDFRDSLQQSGNMVQREYDRYFANLGPKFAEGDCKSVAVNRVYLEAWRANRSSFHHSGVPEPNTRANHPASRQRHKTARRSRPHGNAPGHQQALQHDRIRTRSQHSSPARPVSASSRISNRSANLSNDATGTP